MYRVEVESKCSSGGSRRLLTGLIFIIAGGLFAAKYLNALDPEVENYIFTWQSLLIGIGIISLTSKNGSIGGIILITVGAIFLLPKFGFVDENVHHLWWPAVLIIIGLFIIFKSFGEGKKSHRFTKKQNDMDVIDEHNVFGGGMQYVTSKNFKGGKIVSVFGGSKIDLTSAELAEGTSTLDITNIFGGTELIIPNTWKVKSDVTSIFGGFNDKKIRHSTIEIDEKRELLIKGVMIFGGGDVKRI